MGLGPQNYYSFSICNSSLHFFYPYQLKDGNGKKVKNNQFFQELGVKPMMLLVGLDCYRLGYQHPLSYIHNVYRYIYTQCKMINHFPTQVDKSCHYWLTTVVSIRWQNIQNLKLMDLASIFFLIIKF